MVKQKQSQKVVINIGDLKPKPKRRAPRKKAPARKGVGPSGGGGPGGGGVPGTHPSSTVADFLPRPFAFFGQPLRGGPPQPVVEPLSQFQQLIKPLEQGLLRLESSQAKQQEEQLTMKKVQDYMAQYVNSVSYAPDPEYSSSSSPVIEEIKYDDQVEPETGTQFVVEQPDQPLVKPDGVDPLVDNVRPVEEKAAQPAPQPEPRPRRVVIEDEEWTPAEIQQIRDQGKLPDLLKKLQVSRTVKVDDKKLSLIQVARFLGMKTSRSDYALDKAPMIKKILDFVAGKK